MLGGVFFMGFFLSVLISIDLGTDPCACFCLGLADKTGILFGTMSLTVNLLLGVFVFFLDPKQIGFGTLGNMILVGYLSDFFRFVWGRVLPQDFFASDQVRFLLLIPALAGMVVSASCYMAADLGMAPYDAVPFVICKFQKRLSFRWVRVIWDVLFIAGGFLLGSTVGIVTVAMAFLLGPVINYIKSKLEARWEAKEPAGPAPAEK